ncbi:MAG: 4Fe-4S binding protein [Cyclobacteriaceae bacterium]|nr:4Fe-4S binding protein [Cyclobacteriaceae bacterium]
MKIIKNIGLLIFMLGLFIFTLSTFLGEFTPTKDIIKQSLSEQQYENIGIQVEGALGNKTYLSPIPISSTFAKIYNSANNELKAKQQWDKVMWDSPQVAVFQLIKSSSTGIYMHYEWLIFLLTFGLSILGSLMYILPDVILLGSPGIKNNKIFQSSATNRGWIGWVSFVYLVLFYIILYFFPALLTNQILIVNPISMAISGNASSQWFLYGFIYCTIMSVMAVRMFIKYRHSNYQLLRTGTVLFFQIAFAFLIPEILMRFNLPYMDFKNAWPLDYDFFFEWNINGLIASGNIGLFMFVWGVIFSLLIIPTFTYFYGKRWYCSWVCGCGGLAETLGDPYRQLSDKSEKAWKIERYLIHSVLVLAIIMTGATLYTYFTGSSQFIGISTYDIQKSYGFLIGAVFSGIIGTGFYPILGNRVWCRFGCPLAAYMGLIQRFKSRFRITTNGGQCISCGNCSTYCEMGIDVRWYAQRGQNIVRSSCVGCGVCSSVCPRGVLNLENKEENGRFGKPTDLDDNGLIISNT